MPEVPEQRTDRARYPSHRTQVKNARHRAERVVREWGVGAEVVANVVSVVDELVANAVTHARVPKGREVGVTIWLLDSVIRVEVRDADATPPTPRKSAELMDDYGVQDLSEEGRGLLLVELLFQRWGSSTEVIGKTVWAECALYPAEVTSC
jgi:serine/threonine-protein kinase RsbW